MTEHSECWRADEVGHGTGLQFPGLMVAQPRTRISPQMAPHQTCLVVVKSLVFLNS